jgi:hypothetical protein
MTKKNDEALSANDPNAPLRAQVAALLHAISAGPTEEQLRSAPLLTAWQVVVVPYTGRPVIAGTVTGHPLLLDGPITTSVLVHLTAHEAHSRTWSRWYRLGKPTEMPDAAVQELLWRQKEEFERFAACDPVPADRRRPGAGRS